MSLFLFFPNRFPNSAIQFTLNGRPVYVTDAISHTFSSRQPCVVVTFTDHGVALKSLFAAKAVVLLESAGLARCPFAATAFPIAVTYSWGLA